MTLLAFHNDEAVKAKYLARLEAHRTADEIIHGTYWDNGTGCAVGCTVHSGDHEAYERELGLPAWLARLEDGLFESLPNGESKDFPLAFLSAIPTGADVCGVRDQFLAWLMDDPIYGLAFTAREDEIKALAAEVGRRLRTGDGVTGSEADVLTEKLRAARDAWGAWAAWAAWDARGARAAWAAWDAWGARGARDALDARDARDAWDGRAAWAAKAAWTALDARDARDARGGRDAKAAWAAFVEASAAELLRLLAAAPVAKQPKRGA